MLKRLCRLCGICFCLSCYDQPTIETSSTADTASVSSAADAQDTVGAGVTQPTKTFRPDTLVWVPGQPDTEDVETLSHFRGRAVRVSVDSIRLTLERTPGAARADKPLKNRVADSLAVTDLFHTELLNTDCRLGSVRSDGVVVGIVSGGVWDKWERPRAAWKFDILAMRIRPIPADSVFCLRMRPEE
jgi:hypothetical protein